MRIFFRVLRIIIEIVVAIAIFIIIVKETPLFDRAIPDRNKESNTTSGTQNSGTNNNDNIATPTVSGTKVTTLTTTRYTREIIDKPVRLGRSCTTPSGQIIADHQSIIAYSSSIANSKNECQSEVRVCNNGKLSGAYTYQTCDYMIDGRITRTIGGKIVTIDSNTGASDRDQTFIDLSDYLAAKKRKEEYIQPSQEPDHTPLTIAQIRAQTMNNSDIIQPARDLTDTLDQSIVRSNSATDAQTCRTPRGTSIQNGSFVYAYDMTSSTNTMDCTVQKRSCINGKLTGTYSYRSCNVAGNQNANNLSISVTSSPSTLFHGTLLATVPYVIPFNQNLADRFIIDNAPSQSNGGQNYIEFADCHTPRGTTIKNHERVIAYRLPTEISNSQCNPEPRVCRDGVLGGSYTYPSCTGPQPIPHQPSWLQKTANNIGNWWRGLW